jgi:hypothetical protein
MLLAMTHAPSSSRIVGNHHRPCTRKLVAFPTTIVRYTELLGAPLQRARHLSEFAGLDSSQRAIEDAAAFITKPRS